MQCNAMLCVGTNNAIEILDLSWNQMRKTAAVLICSGLKVCKQAF